MWHAHADAASCSPSTVEKWPRLHARIKARLLAPRSRIMSFVWWDMANTAGSSSLLFSHCSASMKLMASAVSLCRRRRAMDSAVWPSKSLTVTSTPLPTKKDTASVQPLENPASNKNAHSQGPGASALSHAPVRCLVQRRASLHGGGCGGVGPQRHQKVHGGDFVADGRPVQRRRRPHLKTKQAPRHVRETSPPPPPPGYRWQPPYGTFSLRLTAAGSSIKSTPAQ